MRRRVCLPWLRAEEARLALSFSLSLPRDLDLALASPRCSVECQLCGRVCTHITIQVK